LTNKPTAVKTLYNVAEVITKYANYKLYG